MSSPSRPDQSPHRPDPAPGPPPRPAAPRRFPWLWPLLLLALIAWNVYTWAVPKAPPALTLTYSAFMEQVGAGNVASLNITGQAIDGAFKSPVIQPVDAAATPPAGASTVVPGTATATAPATSTRFTTVAPPEQYAALVPLLQQQGVIVTAKDTGGGSFLADLAIGFLPVLLLVGVIVFMARNAQRGQQNMFGFGGSRARVYNAETPSVTFADVAGEEQAKQELLEIVDFLKSPGRYQALGARLPRGVLLIGPPGTGKTLLARAVAGQANVPFFSISASEFVEMFVGVGASRVRDLFTKAKAAAPSIVFVDELDAVGRQRGAGLGGGNDEREQTLNQLLVEMDGFDQKTSVIVLSATNRPDVLDPALLRPGRFDRQVTVGLPDRTGREAILKIHTRKLPLDPDVDLGVLARRTPGFSGADLANLANEAVLYTARRGATNVTVRDFDDAMDKIVLGTQQAKLMGEEERRLVAYHEAGHALVAELTPGADPVNKVSIIPHGQALGITEQLPEEERHSYPKDYLVGRLAAMMGGRTAEEMVFGQPTTGAESDLKAATNLARRMVGLWGMSDTLGPVYYGVGETHPFLGREIGQPREYAEATAAELDIAVRGLIEQSKQRALEVLEKHRPSLDALAGELLAHETIDRSTIQVLLADDRAAIAGQDTRTAG